MNEEWRPIPDATGYEVSSRGRVRNRRTGRILRLGRRKDGYLQVRLYVCGDGTSIHRRVHRCVASAFLGDAPQPSDQAAHGNGRRSNNELPNIRWAPCKENHADMRVHGTAPVGENNGRAKLTEADIVSIRKLIRCGVKQAEIAEMFGVCRTTIVQINTGKLWRHVKWTTNRK